MKKILKLFLFLSEVYLASLLVFPTLGYGILGMLTLSLVLPLS